MLGTFLLFGLQFSERRWSVWKFSRQTQKFSAMKTYGLTESKKVWRSEAPKIKPSHGYMVFSAINVWSGTHLTWFYQTQEPEHPELME
jgi:hypothetical protein